MSTVRNEIAHAAMCKCMPACKFRNRTACPAWQEYKKEKSVRAKQNRLIAAKRRVRYLRMVKKAPNMPATDCRKDVLGWQLTSGKFIKA
jgi:hypothetical protein